MVAPKRVRKINWPLTLAVDTETTGLKLHHKDRAFSVPMMDEHGKSFYWEWAVNPKTREVEVQKKDVKKIEETLDSYEHWVFHHAKFDIRALSLAGVDVEKLGWRERIQDTVLASHVCESNSPHGLKYIGETYFGISKEDKETLQKVVIKARREGKKLGWNLGDAVEEDYWMPAALARHTKQLEFWEDERDLLSPETYAKVYALTDVKRTILAWIMYRKLLIQEGLLHNYQREIKLLPIVYDMETKGVTIHERKLDSEAARYRSFAKSCEKKCLAIARRKGVGNLNIDSNPQVAELIHGKEGFKVHVAFTTKTGNPQLDSKLALPHLLDTCKGDALKFVESFSSRKKANTAAKYLTGYHSLKVPHYEAKQTYWCLHASFNQTGTGTTRFSATSPNPQNVGKGDDDNVEEGTEGDYKLRTVFGPRPGRIWYCIDYSQLQLRIFAYASKQKEMIRAFQKGYDFHNYIASVIYEKEVCDITKNEKRVGKAINFGFIFGAGANKVNRTAGMPGVYEQVQEMFPNAADFMATNMAFAEEHGYVETMAGYRLYVPMDRKYAATCYKVQGTEGDIVKNGMIDVNDYLSDIPDHYLTMCVHDELVFDFPLKTKKHHNKFLKNIVHRMEAAGENIGVITPVNIEVCYDNWAEAEKVQLA